MLIKSNFCAVLAGERIAGIQYKPESIHGMRENLERILQFMAAKRIRMHQITSKEVLEGNLKAIMRLILALAAHYKPQSVRHHDTSYENVEKKPAAVPPGNHHHDPPPHHHDPTKVAQPGPGIVVPSIGAGRKGPVACHKYYKIFQTFCKIFQNLQNFAKLNVPMLERFALVILV